MILELTAGRLASRQFGASLYSWTSVIGVTLTGLTFGNYLGGRLADAFSAGKTIGRLLAACSAACVAAIILNNLADKWTFLWGLDLATRIPCQIAIEFFIPTALIGAVVPVAVKMALEKSRHRGGTVGGMYALGAAGSILGTFLAGFWLIATVGTINTIWLVSGAMLLGAVIYLSKSILIYAFIAVIAFLMVAGTAPAAWAQRLGSAISLRQMRSPDLLYETESQYSYVAVRQISKQPDERQFIQDNMKNHSRIIMGDIRDLRFFYTQVYAAATHRIAGDKKKLRTLSIGGGGYVFPRYILDVWPGSHVEVAEIDPAVTKAATLAFGLDANTPIKTINLDGRNYVDELLERKRLGRPASGRGLAFGGEIPQYDIIYMDAFNDMSVPFQLVTRQFNEKISAILAFDGVYVVNLIDMADSARFLAGFVNALEKVFPQVYVTARPSPDDLPTNFVVIAGKRPVNLENLNAEESLAGRKLYVLDDNDLSALRKKSGGTALDDDYAPLENFMAPVVQRAWAAERARQYTEQGDNLNASGKWEKAVSRYRRAAQLCPAIAPQEYFLIGQVLADHGKLEEATPNFEQALKLDPDNLRHHLAAAEILAAQGRYDEAIQRLNNSIRYMQNSGRSKDAEQLKQMLRKLEAGKPKK
jgi:spermidine synthase